MMSLLSHPRHWPMLLLMLLLRLLCLLPYRVLMAFGYPLGWLLRTALRSRVRVARRNLELTHPELDEAALSALLRKSFTSLGQMVFETGLAWWSSNRRIDRLSTVRGLENLNRLLDDGRGVLLVSAHFTTLEIGTRILCQAVPGKIAGLYRKHGNPTLDKVVRASRLSYAKALFDRSQSRQAVKHMRQGGALWYAADQDYGRGESVFVPFMGVMASTITSSHHLARMGRAAVIIVSQRRLAAGQGYELTFSSPLEEFPSADISADCQRLNDELGALVMKNPSQYMWLHRRFKTRPPGEERIY